MKISYQWLNQLVDLKEIDPQKLADQVSLTGIEVASVIAPDAGLKNIVVGHILSVVPHPDSDHLNICQVEIGAAEPVQIVCGAPNVAANQYVIVALPSARIANNVKIKRGKMRGEVSNGMICALQEIGFSDSVVPKEFQNGIYVFPDVEPVGEPVFKLLGMDDRLLDFDITPNRADTLGMHGAAYEVGAMLHEPTRFPEVNVKETGTKMSELIDVSVECPDLVPKYCLKVVENVQIKPSPLWLQIRLWNNGIRPINNVVDVTNFVLLEYGQPLHAFDYDKLKRKEIIVRTARNDEQFTTLDGENRKLNNDDLVITDGEKPIALAGIMGGLDSEITSETKNVIIESAVFNGTNIRKTAQRTNLRTEASIRYEKGINEADVQIALNRAVQLMCDLSNGTASEGIAVGNYESQPLVQIELDPNRVNHVLGTEIKTTEMAKIFDELQFKQDLVGGKLQVTVPQRRWDISIEADLVEEIARLYGYDRLPSTLPTGIQTIGHYNRKQQLIKIIRQQLLASGLDEVISYSLLNKQQAEAFTLTPTPEVKLSWPMTQDHAYLRQGLVSGLVTDLQYNLAHKQSDVAIFEQGNVFQSKVAGDAPKEVPTVAALWSGQAVSDQWLAKSRNVDFYEAKGVIEALGRVLGLENQLTFVAEKHISELHPGRSARIILGDQTLGYVGEIHPNLQHELDLPMTFVMQLDLNVILDQELPTIISESAAKYPAVERDLALIVDTKITNSSVIKLIKATGGKYLTEVHVFDVFTGEKVGLHKQSLAYRLHFQNPIATLQDDQINQIMTKITDILEQELSAQVR